ncbi:class I SAM-dependent methyltransferase [Streptomyces sp. NBC_01298]|uniref:class I SAM-dependent methyltransferase n=1 Tax=Streptomyces sp. NBC_01298 TaxID=2903817 RepID=UPI002E11A8EC|nr:class I SAM-dependent methyltransferase [Streptomyces sp. NBC_01298]
MKPTPTDTLARDTGRAYADGVLGHDRSGEYERLRLLERISDPATIRVLDRLPMTRSWHCADIGAGTGSLAHHLAERCPDGQVTATDLDTRYLDAMPRPDNLTVLRQDVTREDFPPASLDLVHVRALLTHLSEPAEVVRRMVSWLKPGGWLVIEDPTYLPAEASPQPEFAALLAACGELLARTQGTDNTWARKIPAAMADAGLTDVAMSAELSVCGRSEVEDAYWRQCFTQATPGLLAHGLMTGRQIQRAIAHFDDPGFADAAWLMVSCWARRR